ncbi:RNA-directed DNA polymerase, eukaryota [Tanacetum coccineum]
MIRSDALPTRINISRRGIDIQSISCPICDHGAETSDHLFFKCNMVREIGRKIARWWNINFEEVNSYEEWKTWIVSCRMDTKLKHMFEGICYDSGSDHADVQATRSRERVAEEAQAQAYLAAFKADAAAQRANVVQQNSEANNAALG